MSLYITINKGFIDLFYVNKNINKYYFSAFVNCINFSDIKSKCILNIQQNTEVKV